MRDQEKSDLARAADASAPESCLFFAEGVCHNAIVPHTGQSCPYNRLHMPHCRRYKPETRTPDRPSAGAALDKLPSISKLVARKSEPPADAS